MYHLHQVPAMCVGPQYIYLISAPNQISHRVVADRILKVKAIRDDFHIKGLARYLN